MKKIKIVFAFFILIFLTGIFTLATSVSNILKGDKAIASEDPNFEQTSLY